MAKKALRIALCWAGFWAGFCGWAEGQGPQPGSPGIEKATAGVNAPTPAVVMIYNRPIVAFRDTVFGSSPQQRARGAEERINALIESGQIGPVTTRPTSEGPIFSIAGRAMFILSPGDLDPVAGECPFRHDLFFRGRDVAMAFFKCKAENDL